MIQVLMVICSGQKTQLLTKNTNIAQVRSSVKSDMYQYSHTSLPSEGIGHANLSSKLGHMLQHTTSLLGKVKGWRETDYLSMYKTWLPMRGERERERESYKPEDIF